VSLVSVVRRGRDESDLGLKNKGEGVCEEG
jgi:hypothetical protein